MKRRHVSITFLACLSLILVTTGGCKKEAEEPEPEETTGAEPPPPPPEPEPAPVAAPEPTCDMETVYFAFDSSELDATSRAAVQEAVDCFNAQEPNVSLLLTGACDPRGTEEYNLALGERRAESVRNYMSSLGMNTSQISVTSVGEENATGTDEAGWARDRNVTATKNNY